MTADGHRQELPVSLELFDFALPDENSLHAMMFYSSDQPELYHGRHMDAEYHRFAHRQRIELVHGYDIPAVNAALGRFTGSDFGREARYEGPGEGVGNVIVPASFYGPGSEYDDRASAWSQSDAWMTFLARSLPKALTFLYMPDEPGRRNTRASCAWPTTSTRTRAQAGRCRSSSRTSTSTRSHRRSTSGVRDRTASRSIARAGSGPAGMTTGSTTAAGRPEARSRSTRRPPTRARPSGPASSTTCSVYFYWHAVHWRHNSQKVGERNQNVWADSITFDNRGQPNKPVDDQGYIHGDGVLLYPGEDALHPEEDRGIAGRSRPCSWPTSAAGCRTIST